MLGIISFLALILPITAIPFNVGTALYTIDDVASKTWTTEDVAILRSRILMDQLIPKKVVGGKSFLKYVRIIVNKFETISSDKTRKIAMVTACDVIGAYLQGVMLPHVKDGYYNGHESYAVTNELFALERKIKFILDTDGRGWMTPVDAGQQRTAVAAAAVKKDDADDPIFEETENACAALLTNVVPSGRELITAVPVPAFDDNKNPGSLAFPFVVGKRLFSVDRPWLAADDHRPLLVRYYRLAAGCTSPAPEQFRADMHLWLDNVVAPLLADRNRWYPVLAGAARVVRAAAKAAGVDVTAAGRPKRKVTAANTTSDLTEANDDGGDGDVHRSCDDGTDGQVPNVNVSLAVILLSLLSTWISFWAFGFERQSQTVTYSRKPDTVFNF
ncbi:uncharacterized protein LOC100568831 [Acyrthosiphon pisum]|uniref:Uncharacterized protein n=1 Tax=Acyrthosiphon pisum TaxID=7029 RepID=A0A8R1W814_ACYPI|nr:uncharacterized protein LOC100568831 [Acyrthosiphon pisum]|eukprot:XP_003244136.1 PREDICTED: uncharacterized protein LOC100568831 [Acyrthosiphon pisum]